MKRVNYTVPRSILLFWCMITLPEYIFSTLTISLSIRFLLSPRVLIFSYFLYRYIILVWAIATWNCSLWVADLECNVIYCIIKLTVVVYIKVFRRLNLLPPNDEIIITRTAEFSHMHTMLHLKYLCIKKKNKKYI